MLIALLSLSDYIWLILDKVDVPHVVIFSFFYLLTLIGFVYCNSISIRKSVLLVFILLYFIVISIYNNDNIGFDGFTVLLSYLTVYFIFMIFSNKSLFELLDLLSKSLFFYLLMVVFFEVINKTLGGQNLIIVFQNNLPYLLLFFMLYKSLSKASGYQGRGDTFKFSVCLFFIYIVFVFFEFGKYRIQFKTVILLGILLIPLIFEKTIVKHFKKFKFLLLILIVLSISFFWLIQEQLEIFVNASGRLGSSMLRVEIFNTIMEEFKSLGDIAFGTSLGSSSNAFQVSYNNSLYELHSHVGFASLMLDYGLLGILLLFLFPCALLLFKVRNSPQSFLYAFLLIICWLYMNVVYLSAIPISNVYNFSMLSLILISINIFIKFTNGEKK